MAEFAFGGELAYDNGMQSDLPTPKILLEEAVARAIAAAGCRPEELVGISAHLCPSEGERPFRWEVGVEPSRMRDLEPHFIRVQVDAETGEARPVEVR